MTCAAAKSICSVVAVCAVSILVSVWEVLWVLFEVDGLPSWYRYIRFRGMGSRSGGWIRVVGFFKLCLRSGVVMLPICGRSCIRALRSPYSGVWVVIFVFISPCSVWLSH
jgi:hypothetical protein